jgi:hypothetical protein
VKYPGGEAGLDFQPAVKDSAELQKKDKAKRLWETSL